MTSPAEIKKVLDSCSLLNSKPGKMTPKKFLEIYMSTANSNVAYLRQYWSTDRGLKSTMQLLPLLRNEILRTDGGREAWTSFIQQEAVDILVSQEAPRGNYPQGSFHSSLSVEKSFFTSEEQARQDTALTNQHMPFFLWKKTTSARHPVLPEDFGEVAYHQSLTGHERLNARFRRVATTICSMVAFSNNRRHNGLQLNNSVRFYACGISERVQEYLSHLGLCSSRKTALSALKTLSIEGRASIKAVTGPTLFEEHGATFTSPILCSCSRLEATLYYCLRIILKNEHENLGDECVTLTTDRWNAVVEECYERFCSPQAQRQADKAACPKLGNTLIQLHDFSSVVEVKRSMRAGDVGRLMNAWKKWCIMTQGLTGLTNYSSYPPRMVLLLTVILPPDLRKYLCHNLLISPSGRSNHFVAKDQWLECQNYWIKFLFNQTGNGHSVDRLKELFSLNIGMFAVHPPSCRKCSNPLRPMRAQQSYNNLTKIT
ncbi:hypothetical protein MJO28_014074 [Puccinia striiformis f. sp. tritici]|uniref:DUF6589 domain-containing protein n=2 Tax=Puccinia striiformis TaxID=27350 RepID=A0A2S4V9B1_9BASI|nr:hypothetical protein MJO28_014074 [Puccinia striiformis f. sp. tritici]POW06040.1 hypothetical protein PSTT_09246 [Puccinia striiformis]